MLIFTFLTTLDLFTVILEMEQNFIKINLHIIKIDTNLNKLIAESDMSGQLISAHAVVTGGGEIEIIQLQIQSQQRMAVLAVSLVTITLTLLLD